VRGAVSLENIFYLFKKKLHMKKFILLTMLIVVVTSATTDAQVGINEDNSQPDATAILDVKSTTKGVLIPRMTSTQKAAITTPATGLIVYDNTISSFWYYNGATQTEMSLLYSIRHKNTDKTLHIHKSRVRMS
jgi:hypothetical protein